MNDFQNRISQLLAEAENLTDIMLNAVKAQALEVFEYNLDERQKILDEYETLRNESEGLFVLNEELKVRISAILEKDELITEHLGQMKQLAWHEYQSVLIEKKRLLQTKKRADKYVLGGESNLSGSIFDKQK